MQTWNNLRVEYNRILFLPTHPTADPDFLDPNHFISALRPSGSIVVGESRYEERDPQTAGDSLLAAGNAGPLNKRRRHYITKKSSNSGAEEEDIEGGEAEGASNEVDKRRYLNQLINSLQARRVCVKKLPLTIHFA